MANSSPPTADEGPYQETAICINHENQDSDQMDKFGVTLRTIVNDEGIRQHYLVDVEPRGPANKMRIKDDDEIVLLNNFFVPEKTNNEVIHLFHHVKVDGKTRFRLVIRRKENGKVKSSGNKVMFVEHEKSVNVATGNRTRVYDEWMETSAILAPDFKLNDQPIVKKVESEMLRSNKFCIKVYRRYKTRSRGLYIDISEHGLIANKPASTNGDRTKIIVKCLHFTQDSNGYLTYFASLSNIDEKRYIFIGHDGVSLKEHPDWFTVSDDTEGAIGSNVSFRKNDMYLACNEDTGKIVVSTNKYRFEEIPVDYLDSGAGSTMDIITGICVLT